MSAWEQMLQWERENGIERGPEHHGDVAVTASCDVTVSATVQLRPTLTR